MQKINSTNTNLTTEPRYALNVTNKHNQRSDFTESIDVYHILYLLQNHVNDCLSNGYWPIPWDLLRLVKGHLYVWQLPRPLCSLPKLIWNAKQGDTE